VSSAKDRQARSSARSTSREKSGVRYTDGVDRIRQLDPHRVVEKLREVTGDPEGFKNELPPLPVPGHGEEYDDCGDDLLHFCADCGDPIAVGRTCHRKRCPRCAPAWVAKRATKAGAKLEATRRYLYSKRGDSPKFHHLQVSPPDGLAFARDDPIEAGYEVVKELCDELGIDGGAIVYHPWRGAGDDDRGFWKELLFKGSDWSETVQELSHEPHFHIIAVGDFVPGGEFTNQLYEKTGWTFKRITKGGDDSESNVSLYGEHDLARALTYSLSHAGVCDSKDAYRYFGLTANLSAEGHIVEEIDEVVRAVAPDTLGLSTTSTTCRRELDDEESSSSASPPSNPDPEMDSEGPDGDTETRRCRGRVVSVSNASEFLRDRDWVDEANRVDRLIAVMRGKDPPPTD